MVCFQSSPNFNQVLVADRTLPNIPVRLIKIKIKIKIKILSVAPND